MATLSKQAYVTNPPKKPAPQKKPPPKAQQPPSKLQVEQLPDKTPKKAPPVSTPSPQIDTYTTRGGTVGGVRSYAKQQPLSSAINQQWNSPINYGNNPNHTGDYTKGLSNGGVDDYFPKTQKP